MLNIINTKFWFIDVWFTDQNSKPLETEHNVNMTFVIGQIQNINTIFNWTKRNKPVEGYGFLLFARKFGDKYRKKLMDNATKTGIEAAKTASKRVVQKTAEATEDLIGNKIADRITSASKSKSKGKEKEDETNEIQRIYIPPEKHDD